MGAELHKLTGVMNNIHDTLSGLLVSPTFQSLIYCLNCCYSPPIYHLTCPHYHPFDPPLLKIPPNQPTLPPAPTLTELPTQLHDTQSSIASHIDKVRALEGVIAKHDGIMCEISILRELVEKTTTKSLGDSDNGRNCEEEGEEGLGGAC
jgi:hypothetical protein